MFRAATIAVVLAAGPVLAQAPFCAERAGIAETLARDFGETVVARALRDEITMMEIYANTATGSWSILFVQPNGTACVVAVGEHWQAVVEPVGERS